MISVQLIKPLERAIRSGHPWIYREALAPFEATPGTVITVLDTSGDFCCRGLADAGPIAVRVFSLRDSPIDKGLFSDRIHKALAMRDKLPLGDTTALRLIHGEADLLPGVVIDRYDGYAVLCCDGEALIPNIPLLLEILEPQLRKRGIDNLLLRTKKRHDKEVTALYGSLPPDEFIIKEYGMKLIVNLIEGQKTGMFLDHRESRRRVREWAAGKTVLNLYAYTGGFSISAGLGGATSVTTVDSAPEAIRLAEAGWLANGLPDCHRAEAADVEKFMHTIKPGEFDLIISDPPSFAPKKIAVPKALQAYTMLHRSCLRALAKNGTYIAASCSSHITEQLFSDTIFDAADSQRRNIKIIETWGAGADHPVRRGFPEGAYLKSFRILARD